MCSSEALKLCVWFLKTLRQLVLFHVYHLLMTQFQNLFLFPQIISLMYTHYETIWVAYFLKQLIDMNILP